MPLQCKLWMTGVRDILPRGATVDFAAPEVLQSVNDYCAMLPPEHRLQVEGAKADMYSAGVLLYQMLTGVLPFEAGDMNMSDIKVPNSVPESLTRLFTLTTAMLALQSSWVRLPLLQNQTWYFSCYCECL